MARGIQASQREWLVGGWVGGSGVRVRVPVLMWVSVCVRFIFLQFEAYPTTVPMVLLRY